MNPFLGTLLLGALASSAISSCALGPDYRRPATPSAPTFRGQIGSGTASLADLPWWELFHDEKLLSLIRDALKQSYSLQVAVARVAQARALAGLGTDALLPAINVQAGGAYQQIFSPFLLAPPGGAAGNMVPSANRGNLRYALFQLEGTLSWELDLWGRLRRLRESALADYLASEEARHGVIVSLVGDVAQSYFELLALDRKLAIAKRTVALRRETLHLFQTLEQGGVGNRLQTASEEANLAGAAAAIPNFERQIVLKENQLAVLLGRLPGPIARAADGLDAVLPPALPAGLPATLLERRPDLRQQEAYLISANAQVGAAFAEFFPKLTLSAHGGVASPALQTLFTAGATTFGAGFLAGWLSPLLNGFAIRHRYQAQKENYRVLVATYRQTVLNAFSEVSNALFSIEKLRAQRTQLESEVRARTESVSLAKDRFRNGVASYLDVVQAEQNLFPAELELVKTRSAEFIAMIHLYRALGGGWQSAAPPPLR